MLSRSNLNLDDAEVMNDIKKVSIMARGEDVYVIGGASYFPDYSTMNFEMVEAQYFSADDDNPYAYTFLQLRRL